MAAYARGLGRWASPAIAARLAALLRSDLSPALALDGHEPAAAAVAVAAPASTAAAASSVDVEPAAAARSKRLGTV